MCGKRLRILNENAKRKYFMMRSIRSYGNFMCIKKEYFYYGLVYIILFNLLRVSNVNMTNVYLKTILTCVEYLSYYFIFRDTHILIGNYINIKYKKRSLNLLYFGVTIVSLFSIFRITFLVYVIVAVFMDKNTKQRRSEEHTSELQSLPRNSYAVFCLKKKIALLRCFSSGGSPHMPMDSAYVTWTFLHVFFFLMIRRPPRSTPL